MSDEHVQLKEAQARKRMDRWFQLVYLVSWPILNFFHPIRVLGRENIPAGSAVICPNHSSIGDPFYVVFAFGLQFPMRAMAKIQIMRVPIVGWILGKAGVFGVDRGNTDMRAVKTALTYLKDGCKLLMFPEGTRVKEGLDIQAKTGAALFATRTGAPLLPVYIQPKKRLFRSNIVIIGKPFMPEFEGRKPTPQELDAITAQLMREIYQLGERQ